MSKTDYKNEMAKGLHKGTTYQLCIAINNEQSTLLHTLNNQAGLSIVPQNVVPFHIVIGAFFAGPLEEATIMRWMQRMFVQLQSFPIYLNNFSGMPPHQVYARVLCTPHVLLMRKFISQLNTYLNNYQLPTIQQPIRWILPMLPELATPHYQQALQHFSRQDMAMEITVSKLQLRKLHPAAPSGQLVHVFPFRSQETAIQPAWYEYQQNTCLAIA